MKKFAVLSTILVLAFSGMLQAQEFSELVKTGTPDQVQAAIDQGAKVQTKGDNDDTPLHQAAQFNTNPDVITVLAKAGADLNALDSNGSTPLLDNLANTEKHPDVALALIHAGANVNIADQNGYTPLIFALGKKFSPGIRSRTFKSRGEAGSHQD